MTEVPWTTTEPGLVEKVVAVMLSRENPRAQRVRPSRGDGGLDIVAPAGPHGLVDDYQVKGFATNLTAGQKAQVGDSLVSALATHNDPDSGYTLRNWYVTLPLDATREQQKWLSDLAAGLGVPFACEWRGLAFLDGLAAKYPEVIDYHLRDGRGRVEQAITDLRTMVGLDRDTRDGRRLEPSEAEPALRAVVEALNRDDPHYRYELEITEGRPEPRDRELLVASAGRGGDGTNVTWHVFARFQGADEYRDVPLELAVDAAALDEAGRTAWDRFTTYGQPVRLEGEKVGEMSVDLPGGLGHTGPVSVLALGPAETGGAPLRARWLVLGPHGDDEPRAELILDLDPPSTGFRGGQRLAGRDSTGLVTVEALFPPPDAGAPMTVRIDLPQLPDLAGLPVQRVLPALRFVAAWHTPHRLGFAPEYGPLADTTVALQGDPRLAPEALAYVEALDTVSRHSRRPVALPDLTRVPEEAAEHLGLVADVLRGQRVPVAFLGATLLVPEAELPDLLAEPRLPRRLRHPLTITIQGVEHPLPEARLHVSACLIGTPTDSTPDEHGLVRVPVLAEDGSTAILALSGPKEDGDDDGTG